MAGTVIIVSTTLLMTVGDIQLSPIGLPVGIVVPSSGDMFRVNYPIFDSVSCGGISLTLCFHDNLHLPKSD